MTILYTNFGITYVYKILSLSAALKSNWIDIPVLDYNQLLSFGLSVTKEGGKCGAGFTADFGLDDDSDSIVPIFNLDGFIKITDAVSIGAEMTDLAKLLTGTTRTYAGDYIGRSGTASLMAKFYF